MDPFIGLSSINLIEKFKVLLHDLLLFLYLLLMLDLLAVTQFLIVNLHMLSELLLVKGFVLFPSLFKIRLLNLLLFVLFLFVLLLPDLIQRVLQKIVL